MGQPVDSGQDLGLPVLTLVVDEQTAEGAVLTRIEAFVDMLVRKKDARSEESGHPIPGFLL